MPRLTDNEEMIKGAGSFQYSGVRVEKLTGASEYTLVTIAIDRSGSVQPFESRLLNMLKSIILSCKKSDRAENLLIRIITFSDNIQEIHGFRLLSDIDVDNDYTTLSCGGLTALYDASFDATTAIIDYAGTLVDDYEFDVNAIIFVATDGCDNRSTSTPSMTKDAVKDGILKEKVESCRLILIKMREVGLPDNSTVNVQLKEYADEAGIDQFIDIGDATEDQLAKTAQFVSQSISSQSQSLGTGGPSQSLTF